MNSWNSVPSLAIDRQFLRVLQTSLHEIILENTLALAVKETGADNVSLEVGFDITCSQT